MHEHEQNKYVQNNLHCALQISDSPRGRTLIIAATCRAVHRMHGMAYSVHGMTYSVHSIACSVHGMDGSVHGPAGAEAAVAAAPVPSEPLLSVAAGRQIMVR